MVVTLKKIFKKKIIKKEEEKHYSNSGPIKRVFAPS
jgi:hypothetical protein